MHRILVLSCVDGRVRPKITFGSHLPVNLVEAPVMASAVPPDLKDIVVRYDVDRIVVMMHAEVPSMGKCGARDAVRCPGVVMDLPMLYPFLSARNIKGSVFQQARSVASAIDGQFNGDVLVCVFDHVLQQAHPIMMRLRGQNGSTWASITDEDWRIGVKCSFSTGIPTVNVTESAWMNNVIQRIGVASKESGNIARLFDFANGQSFGAVILNTTCHVPTSMPKVMSLLMQKGKSVIDPFTVYWPKIDPAWAPSQLVYVLHHLELHNQRSRLILIGTPDDIVHMRNHLDALDWIRTRVKEYFDMYEVTL